ncbi:MarR family transcriptional regulator [Oscillochloris sp. ZM17-4]|uniref:MarR family winged helix-turn-helix transcriptional regulator n=1 Tax=Oscillochloris sp. ZM17-4 TaxID=2866714 RepID=UPI001C737E61|nr:MarR family transcriptional regulator [Oscillochloris sp. ZM17-4]MBX0329619.1 MarR family transcriptional regulator [Oscillochloris sp. ZM17-4]
MEPITETDTLALAELVTSVNMALNVHSMGTMLAILREADLSLPRLVALNYLHKSGPASISQISEHLNLALGTTSHVVDQLVQGGCVERRESEHDRRHKEVSLTAEGMAVIERFRKMRMQEAAQRLACLSPQLCARLGGVLEEVVAALHIADSR